LGRDAWFGSTNWVTVLPASQNHAIAHFVTLSSHFVNAKTLDKLSLSAIITIVNFKKGNLLYQNVIIHKYLTIAMIQ
jgi:hypothetical protein